MINMRTIYKHSVLFLCYYCTIELMLVTYAAGYSPGSSNTRTIRRRPLILHAEKEAPKAATASSYEDTDAASQGLVSSLTGLVNSLSEKRGNDGSLSTRNNPPTTVEELSARIRGDYVENNYLWTGQLDLQCFDPSCKFTDPTLSFEGTDTFLRNTQNLVPLVERFVQNYQSILLDIQTTPEYIETRWNMVGELNTLLWKPKIDVIGQTKFWFRKEEPGDSLQIYEYDEKWEVPAYQALLQLVTPAGTFPNSTTANARGL
jgi:hypothetical protein